MNIELLTLGNELLDGRRVDTNTAWIGRYLSNLGLQIRFRQSTLDHKEDIIAAVRMALSRSDLVITTGGLGPTQDDLTFEAVAEALGRSLVYHPDIEKKIQEKYAARGIPCPASNRRQAMLPQGAIPIGNPGGTAPGCLIEMDKKMIFCFPGVPSEMKFMVETFFTDTLRTKVSFQPSFQKTYSVSGIAEARVEEMIQEAHLDHFDKIKMHVAYTATESIVDVTFTVYPETLGQKEKISSEIDRKFFETFTHHLMGWNGKTIQEHLVERFKNQDWKLAIAESLTGGMITSKIVDVPGCSSILHGGFITYSYESKTELLGVRPETLRQYGAVSVDCVLEMARGIHDKTGTTFSLATTGIAGPTGATDKKPNGLTYIAWIGPKLEKISDMDAGKTYVKSTDFEKKVGPKAQNTVMNRYASMIEEHVFHDENGFAIVRGFVFSGDRKRNRMLATYHALMGLHSFTDYYL